MTHSPMELAEAFIRTGEIDEALTTLNQQLQASPDDDHARRLRAAVLLRLRGEANFRAALDDLAHLKSPTPDDHTQRSVILEQMGDLSGALAALQVAYHAKPGDERLTERRLHLLAAQGRIAEARALAEQLPPTWRWRQWAGDMAAKMGDDSAAVEHYTQAINHFADTASLLSNKYAIPTATRLLLVRGHAYCRLELAAQAEADYRAAEKLIPTDPGIVFNIGLARAMQGDLDEAVTLCRTALANALPVTHEALEHELHQDARWAELAARVEGNP